MTIHIPEWGFYLGVSLLLAVVMYVLLYSMLRGVEVTWNEYIKWRRNSR
jgi:hypothetical protein